jgi:hypothetical protein
MIQVLECLLWKHKALSSKPSPAKAITKNESIRQLKSASIAVGRLRQFHLQRKASLHSRGPLRRVCGFCRETGALWAEVLLTVQAMADLK